MTRIAITSAIALLGFAGFAGGAFAKASGAKAPGIALRLEASDVNVTQVSDPAPSATLGTLKVISPADMKNDFVYIDGGYQGTADSLKTRELTSGTHELMMRSQYGATDYWRDIGIAVGETTTVRPFPAENTTWNASGYLMPSAPYLPPPAAASSSAATDSGSLQLETPAAMNHDAVFVDGSYYGRAQNLRALRLAPGMHHIVFYGIDGVSDYQQNVNIALHHTTEIQPFANVLAEAAPSAGD